MKKFIAILLLLSTMAMLFASCGSEKIERGTVVDKTYTNESIGITYNLPSGWEYYTDEEIAKLMNIAAENYKDENILNSAKITTVIDFMAFNPSTGDNVNLSFENLIPSDSTKITVDEYIEVTKKNLSEQLPNVSYQFDNVVKVTIGGTEYTRLTASCSSSGINMKQYIYVTKVGTYMVCISASTIKNVPAATFEAMFS